MPVEREATAVRLSAALALAIGALAACGRVGYDPAVAGQPEVDGGRTGDGGASPEGGAGEPAPVPESAADAGPVEQANDGPLPADTTPPPADAARPPDAGPDAVDTGPVMSGCVLWPAADLIADFEDGTLSINKVGRRGGTTFHMVDSAHGTITNVPLSYCGQRVMRLQPIGTPPRAPLAQARFMPDNPSRAEELFDARAYAGIVVVMRASTPTAVRVKLPNDDTIRAGNDHFQVSFTVGTGWTEVSFAWSAFRQQVGTSPLPRFDVSTLFMIEISASLPVGATLWVDQIAFVR